MAQTSPPAEIPTEKIHAAHRTVMIIMSAIAASFVLYAAAVEFLGRSQPDAVPIAGADTVRIVFFVFGGIAIFTATVLKSMLLRTAPPTPIARLMRLQTSTIIAAAFAELPAVLGLALFITTRRRGDFYILLVVAAYMIVRHFPQRHAWETYVRRGTDAR